MHPVNIDSPQSHQTWFPQRVPQSYHCRCHKIPQSKPSIRQGAHKAPPPRNPQHALATDQRHIHHASASSAIGGTCVTLISRCITIPWTSNQHIVQDCFPIPTMTSNWHPTPVLTVRHQVQTSSQTMIPPKMETCPVLVHLQISTQVHYITISPVCSPLSPLTGRCVTSLSNTMRQMRYWPYQ
jgi:hypothetical protein